MKNFYIGAAYYPELWDKNEIDKDIAQMKAYGMNCMRIAEFAWSEMEPSEGKFNFDMFKYVADKLYENGIYTIMCTPSCTPPRWVFEKYPDANRVISEAYAERQYAIHSRCHPCKSHKGMRELNAKITGEMAKAFANHPGVIGWQSDNEIYMYDDGCFCENCKKGFRDYLKNKYKTIENLNKRWGMHRWSLDYTDFDQIDPPVKGTWENPSRQTNWIEFQESLICSYVEEQANAIRKYSDAPIGTDMMTNNFLSYNKVNKNLDVVQHNHYHTNDNFYRTIFNYDFYRTLKNRPFWVTETLLGWNGSIAAYGGYRNNGYCYINSLAPIVHGAEMNLYWLFRSHPNGHELGHGAFLSSTGRPNVVSKSVKMITDTLTKCDDFLSSSRVKSKIAMTYSTTAQKVFTYAPLVANFDHDIDERFIDKFHKIFRHYNIDVIETDKELGDYEIILSPFLANATENGFNERIVEWIKNGGTWIVGPLSDVMTGDANKYTDAPYSFLEELAGVYTKYQLPIEVDEIKARWNDGEIIDLSMGFDAYELNGAEALAKYDSDELDNLTAVAKRSIGKGQIIILGSVPDKKALLKLVNEKPILQASDNIDLTVRSGSQNGIIAMEIENKHGYVLLDKSYYDILNEKIVNGRIELAPYTALFLKEM